MVPGLMFTKSGCVRTSKQPSDLAILLSTSKRIERGKFVNRWGISMSSLLYLTYRSCNLRKSTAAAAADSLEFQTLRYALGDA
jgi:hypothetical protein